MGWEVAVLLWVPGVFSPNETGYFGLATSFPRGLLWRLDIKDQVKVALSHTKYENIQTIWNFTIYQINLLIWPKQYLDIISFLVRPVIDSIQAASHVILRDPLV